MNQHLVKNAGEVAVNAMESMPEFKKIIQILRYTNELFEKDHWSNQTRLRPYRRKQK